MCFPILWLLSSFRTTETKGLCPCSTQTQTHTHAHTHIYIYTHFRMCSFTAYSLGGNKEFDYFLDCTFHAVTHTDSSASEFCIVISLNYMQRISLMGSLRVTLYVFPAWNSDGKKGLPDIKTALLLMLFSHPLNKFLEQQHKRFEKTTRYFSTAA